MSNKDCDLRHPADMTCGQALALSRKGWSLVPTKELSSPQDRNEAHKAYVRDYMRLYMRRYRAKKKAALTQS
jgi:hypothetical protein